MSSRPLGNAAAGWESANGTAQEGATAFPASPAPHKVLKPRRRKSVQSNPPSVMSSSSSLLSPENSGDERSPNNRGPPQRPSVSQIGQGAVVPPMPPISGDPPMGVTLVQAAPQDSPSGEEAEPNPRDSLSRAAAGDVQRLQRLQLQWPPAARQRRRRSILGVGRSRPWAR